jgi:PAS domain S-box-containing protein
MNLINPISIESFSTGILESIQEGIVLLDQKQIIHYCNVGATLLFDFERSEMIGCPITNLVPMRYRRDYAQKFKAFARAENVRDMRDRPYLFGLRSNGDEFPLSISITKMVCQRRRWNIAVLRDMSTSSLAVAEVQAEHERLKAETNVLLEEIAALRQKDAETEARLNELAARISAITEAKATAAAGSLKSWLQNLTIWQRIIAVLVSALLALGQGLPVSHVLNQLSRQITELEVLE